MSLKRFAALLGISIVAVLTLYFGVRFINAVFNSAEKQVSTSTATKTSSEWSCRELLGNGEFLQYEDEATCRERSAAGATVIRIWTKPGAKPVLTPSSK